MSLSAIALLRVPNLKVEPGPHVRVVPLDDASLLYTSASFASEPDALVDAVIELVGEDAFAEHEDPRGLFLIPSVAAPNARTYEAVIAEVGEGGMWARLPDEELAGADLQAMLGSMMAQMPAGLLQGLQGKDPSALLGAMGGGEGEGDEGMDLSALLAANPELMAMAGQLAQSMLQGAPGQGGGSPAEQLARSMGLSPQMGVGPGLPAQMGGMIELLRAEGIDLDSDEGKQLLAQVQAQVAANPALLGMMSQLLGDAGDDDDK